MSSPLFSTTSIEMGQRAKPVPILVPFLLKAGGDKLHQALSFDMEKEVLSSGGYDKTSQSFEVGKPSSSLELARRVLAVSCRWVRSRWVSVEELRVALEKPADDFFLERLWKALNHFICRTDLFLWLVILDDQESKGSWWVDVALSPQTWYCSIPLSPGQNQGAWPTPTNEASSVKLGRIKGNLRKVTPVLHVFVFFKEKVKRFFFVVRSRTYRSPRWETL